MCKLVCVSRCACVCVCVSGVCVAWGAMAACAQVTNVRSREDQLRVVRIPDVNPADLPRTAHFSMVRARAVRCVLLPPLPSPSKF